MRITHRLLLLPLLLLALLIPLAGVLSGAGSALSDATRTPPPTLPRYEVVLVVDGARFDQFDLSRMPNLAKLAARGTAYSQASVGQLPSITETSHATIGTGVYPRRHGILGDTWRVPGTNEMAHSLLDGDLDRTGYIGSLMQRAAPPSVAGIIHRRYPGSMVISLSAHKVYAAAAMGAGRANVVAFGMLDGRGHFVPSSIPGRVPAASILGSRDLDLPSSPRTPGLEDDWTTTLAAKFAAVYRPKLMMVNFPEMDVLGHSLRPDSPVLATVMRDFDRDLGRLIAAYKHAHILSRTYFLVTSDHGMVPATHTVTTDTIFSEVRQAGGDPLYVGHGDYCPIWLKNPAATERVGQTLARAAIRNVDAVYVRRHGKYVLVSSPDRLAVPAVRQTYGHLLSSFNSAAAPDVILLYDENTITMTRSYAQNGRIGDHEGATWGSQHVALFLSGPGIKQGYRSTYPARMVDIAPTVETLLGARPAHQDGVPLVDAMSDPPDWARAAQRRPAAARTRDVLALQQEAQARPNS